MSGLRFFDDYMHDLIARERRLREITTNAVAYVDKCESIRQASLPRGDRPASSFYASTEGINASRIILARETSHPLQEPRP